MATLNLFSNFAKNALGGDSAGEAAIDFLSDTIRCALHTTTTSFAQDTDEWFGDVTGEVGSGNGYTSGGFTLTTKAVAQSGATVTFDSADPVWTGATATWTARACIIYKDTGAATTSPLIGYMDFGTDQTINPGDTLTINVDGTNGWFKITRA